MSEAELQEAAQTVDHALGGLNTASRSDGAGSATGRRIAWALDIVPRSLRTEVLDRLRAGRA